MASVPQVLVLLLMGVVMSSSVPSNVSAGVDCVTVTDLLAVCSNFIINGFPDPYPESPCCVAISVLSNLSDSPKNKEGVCRCFMDVIQTTLSNATAIATLPGFCGVSLGFAIDADTHCQH